MDSHRGDWDGGDGLIGSEGAPGIYYSSFPDDTDTKPDLGITALPWMAAYTVNHIFWFFSRHTFSWTVINGFKAIGRQEKHIEGKSLKRYCSVSLRSLYSK